MPAAKKAAEAPPYRASRAGSKLLPVAKGRAGAAEAGRKTPTPAHAPAAPSPLPAQPPDDYVVPAREVVKPADQLALEEKELVEEVGRVLTAANPAAPANVVHFSQREGGYRPEPLIDQLLYHFSLDGCLIHQDSDEAARDRQRRDAAAFEERQRRVTAQSRRVSTALAVAASRRCSVAAGGDLPRASHAGDGGGAPESPLAEGSLAALPPGMEEEGSTAARQLRNQFNFSDRGANTGHGAPRSRASMTEVPPTTAASGSCTRWEIFDAYVEDQERQRQQEELARLKAVAARKGGQAAAALAGALGGGAGAGDAAAAGAGAGAAPAVSARSTRVMERMVQQNLFKDVAMDFKYWDDPADAVRQQEGTLLPLWPFACGRVRGRAVTALAWSPRYFDLFAAGYGSYDFAAPTAGLVVCYSLKSPGAPEAAFSTPAGVLCLDFHPEHPNLLAVGCYDGSVLVFDVRAPPPAGGRPPPPLYASTARSGKHSEPVWQVAWQRTDSHELQFASVSSDGRVTLWSVSKNELSFRDLLVLRLPAGAGADGVLGSARGEAGGGAGAGATGGAAAGGGIASGSTEEEAGEELGAGAVAGGCCFDFHRKRDDLFVVGTEEGALFRCSTTVTSQCLAAYAGHHQPVYAVRWNAHHPRAFLSGGADWTVKLWDALHPKPVMSFDLGSPVGDVAWAPFSATVFAVATEAGRVHVFDVAQSRSAPICAQRAAKKARLTRLAFNARHPVLLVGDDKGGITAFKLSPNLRKGVAPAAPAADEAADAKASLAHGVGATQGGGGGLVGGVGPEAARLEAVLAVAHKCNAAMTQDDWELL
eukprot:scaffold7.g3522.t1